MKPLATNYYQLTTRYVWGRDLSGTLDGAGGVGGLLATEVGGGWYFPLDDNNGNVTDYVSETGEVVASYPFDAFGRTLSAAGPSKKPFIPKNAPTRNVVGSLRNVITLGLIFVASIALGVLSDTTDLLPKDTFCVWPDSLWMRVAQSRMIVVASARRMQGDEAPRYQLNVKEVLKGEANVKELILQLCDYYNDEVNAQVLDGTGGNPVILHLSFTSDTGRIGNSSVCYSIPSIYGAAEPFTMEKAAAIRAEVARQRRQLDEFGSRVKTDQLPHWAKVTNLTAQLTLGPTAQQEAVTKIRGNISRLFPALIAAMDDNANLAKEFLVLPNYSPNRFEQFRRYGPKKVVDLVAALLAEATSVPFGDLFNGASDETRRHVVNGWRVLLLHWLDASDGGYDLQPLAILRASPVRDAIDMKQDGNESPVDNHSRTNTIIGTTDKTQESAKPLSDDSAGGYDDFVL